ncbi:MAG: dihydrofolate reductase family protein [Myxococcota bacterium]|nr:dihydrofolate reductase family protein [Myxococcota bacterium]
MRIFTNTAVSLDGRIGTVGDHHFNVASDEDRRRMGLFRAQADAVFIGGQTYRMGPHPIIEPLALRREGVRRPLINAVLTRRGIADQISDEWPDVDAELAVFGPGLDADAHRARGATCYPAQTPVDVLDHLERMGCKSVLVEGGGDLIFQLVAADRVDTIYMTLAPRIIGGVGAPSLADGAGFTPDGIRNFRLADLERVGDELFLRYDRRS